MIVKKSTLERIKKIIEKHHRALAIFSLGRNNVPKEWVDEYAKTGKPLPENSFLEQVYWHNFLNEQGSAHAPVSHDEMELQQKPDTLPEGEAHEVTKDYVNSNLRTLIDKQKAETISKIEGLIHQTNNEFKLKALQDLQRPEDIDRLMRESNIGAIKRKLRDSTDESSYTWDRIVNTEISNAINLGSADRIVNDNKNKSSDEVYVYRINPNDARTCKYCRRFYIDEDGSPKVYTLAHILGNGTNYGKKSIDWLPVAAATHPNCRDSQLIELRPGWKVLPGGKQTFIGLANWREYIFKKVVA